MLGSRRLHSILEPPLCFDALTGNRQGALPRWLESPGWAISVPATCEDHHLTVVSQLHTNCQVQQGGGSLTAALLRWILLCRLGSGPGPLSTITTLVRGTDSVMSRSDHRAPGGIRTRDTRLCRPLPSSARAQVREEPPSPGGPSSGSWLPQDRHRVADFGTPPWLATPCGPRRWSFRSVRNVRYWLAPPHSVCQM